MTRQEAASALLERRAMRGSLSAFTKKVFSTVDPGTPYKHNWHIDAICEYLEACTRREIKRLVINMPPRMMKSICTTVAWPAWLLGNNPSEQIVTASFSASLSLKHSVDSRLVIQQPWYHNTFPRVQLSQDMNLKSEFMTTERGHRIATSVGGTVTGKGGNILIVDDPTDPQRAASKTERERANEWFDQTFSTRINDEKSGVMVIIMQRLHVEDLTGHVLDKDGWEILNLPMIAEKKEVIDFGRVKVTRKPGDLLHEERMGKKEIAQKKVDVGSYAFAGQYQQRPVPLEGGIVHIGWFKRYKTAPAKFTRIIQSWDTASKDKEVNDPSACLTWGETDKGYYLLDVWKDRVEYPKLKKTATNLFLKWLPDVVLIEDKSSGQALIQDLRADEELKMPIIAIMPTADKVTRMSVASPMIEAGNCWLPVKASWLIDFENEVGNFPNVTHDEQVDGTSQFLSWVKRKPTRPNIRRV